MSALDALQALAHGTNPNTNSLPGPVAGWSFETPTEGTHPGGKKLTSAMVHTTADQTIAIGAWRLKLLNAPPGGSGVRIPFALFFDSADSFEKIEIDLSRFELVSDPQVLTAAHLEAQPNTHLVAQFIGSAPAPVRLLGPSFTLILSGETLDEVDARFGAASGGSAGAAFPSLRFEPPHFLVGGPNSDIGVVCDEVTLDLSKTANPTVVNEFLDPDAAAAIEVEGGVWTGVHLAELGVFVGDGSQVGTWSGMAAMRDFFIDMDGVMSGTFIGELVHNVVDTPQIVITIQEKDGTETDNSDVSRPAPPNDDEYRRFRLIAQPSWSGTTPASGLRPRWIVPAGVLVEEPRRVKSLDLGWVKVPADSEGRTIAVTIDDDRLSGGAPSAQRTITVAAPSSGSASDLQLLIEGVAQDVGSVPATGGSQRLHMGLVAGQDAVITARSRNGSSATLSLDSPPGTGLTLKAGSASQPFSNGTAQWTVGVAAGTAVGNHATIVITTSLGSDTEVRRLRVTIDDPPATDEPDFELVSYTDWRAEPGIGLARFRGFAGLNVDSITWKLASRPVTSTIFSDPASDTFFRGGNNGWDLETIALANSGGTVRPILAESNRLWRLTGTAGLGTAATRRPIVVGEASVDPVFDHPSVKSYLGAAPGMAEFVSTDSPIRFHYDCSEILPNPGDCPSGGVGREPLDTGETTTDRFDRYTSEQVAGFIALYRALEAAIDAGGVDEVGLFGYASEEGTLAHNLKLSENRVEAARTAFQSPSPGLIAAMTASGFTLSAATVSAAAALTVTINHGGELGSSPTSSEWSSDRRVFAIIKPKPVSATGIVVRSEYFITLPGAPPPSFTPAVPEPELQEHPFRHTMFRSAHVEVELLRNELVRLQIRLKLDLEAFNENDLTPTTELNPIDGLTTFFLELVMTDDATGETTYSWELAALSDAEDKDGFATLTDPNALALLGPPAITVPAVTALAGGGRVGVGGFLSALGLGAALSTFVGLDVSVVIWRGIRATLGHTESTIQGFSIAFDYELEFEIDVDLDVVGRFATEEPIKLTFRNVGVDLVHSPGSDPEWLAEFFYSPDDGFAIDIDDPGVFRAGDGIGRLLQVRRVGAGAGSPFYLEFEFGFAFDTGVVDLDTIRIRLSFDMSELATTGTISDVDFAINKIGASVDIPGALKGSGMIDMEESTISGEVDLSLIPLDLRLLAGFKYSSSPFTAFYGFIGAEFAPGIPLGSTGAALYGMNGLLGVNMGRTNDDILQWYKASPVGVHPVSKWKADEGAWAIGVGAVIGTVYDTGFTWNTKGTFLFELPGPKISLATLSKILESKSAASDTSISATIVSVIMLDFENDIFLIGLDFVFEKKPVITFRVPAELYFNLKSARDWHVRFGQWEPASKRITMRLLELWNVYGYLQVEGKELRNGHLNLDGVAIGTGGRVDIYWGVQGLLYLSAYFEYHIGVQFDPFQLQGDVEVGGTLQVGPISLGASGGLRLVAPEPFVIEGRICGCISFFFFDVCGCAKFTIGNGDASLPAPKRPFSELALIDRLSSQKVVDGSSKPTVHKVPIDAVLHVVFDQDIKDARSTPAGGTGTANLRNQVSNDLHYDFRLDDLVITPPVANVQQTWAPYSVKKNDSGLLDEDLVQDADSNRTLRVFDWMPHSHGRALDFAGGYGDTLRALILRLCRDPEIPRMGCASFDEEPYGARDLWDLEVPFVGTVRVLSHQPTGFGSDVIAEMFHYSGARVVPLIDIEYEDRQPEEKCLMLPIGAGRMRRNLRALFPQATTAPPASASTIDPPSAVMTPATLLDIGELLSAGAATTLDDLLVTAHVIDAGSVIDEAPDLAEVILAGSLVSEFTDPIALDPSIEATEMHGVAHRLREPGIADRLRANIDAPLFEQPGRLVDLVGSFGVSPMPTGTASGHDAESTSDRTPAPPNPLALAQAVLAGLVFIQMPKMVSIEAAFAVPNESLPHGEIIFLDDDFQPVSPIIDIADSPTAPSSTAATPLADHEIHVIAWPGGGVQGDDPPTASWAVVNAPGAAQSKPPMDPHSYLLEICGISFGEWKRVNDAAAGRSRTIFDLEKLTGTIGGLPAVAAGELLEPGKQYTVRGSMSWSRYKNATTTDDDGTGAFTDFVEKFDTDPKPPVDAGRYVASTLPVDDRQPHYCQEPTEIMFVSNTIDKMYAKYGLQLVARAKAALGGHVLLQPLSTTTNRFLPLETIEERLLDALNELPADCSSTAWSKLFPRPVLTFEEFLHPNTGYTITLIPRPLGESEGDWDDNLDGDFAAHKDVFRFNVTTSRYPTFAKHVARYRAASVGDLTAGPIASVVSFTASLPAVTRNDQKVDGLNDMLFGGPVELAREPSTTLLWAETAAGTGPFDIPTFACVGILLDGPEPLWKIGAGGENLLSVDVRRAPGTGSAVGTGTPVSHKLIVGERGTRIYVMFDSPIVPGLLGIDLDYRSGTSEERLLVDIGAEPESFNEGGI